MYSRMRNHFLAIFSSSFASPLVTGSQFSITMLTNTFAKEAEAKSQFSINPRVTITATSLRSIQVTFLSSHWPQYNTNFCVLHFCDLSSHSNVCILNEPSLRNQLICPVNWSQLCWDQLTGAKVQLPYICIHCTMWLSIA